MDRVVETFGPDTIEQSMRASALHGQIVLLITRSPGKAVIDISGEGRASSLATIRYVFVGRRASFEAMNGAITVSRLRPVIDRVFAFEEAGRRIPLLHAGPTVRQGHHPRPTGMSQLAELIDRYVSVWNEKDPDARQHFRAGGAADAAGPKRAASRCRPSERAPEGRPSP